jgi:hypothetical protein
VIKKDENLRGIKIKRSGGSGFAYQNVYSTILADLKSSLALG